MSTSVKLPLIQGVRSTPPKRWRPGPFEGQPGELDRSQLDTALKAIYDHAYSLEQSSVQAVVEGTKMASGALIVPAGGKLKAVATGLQTLSNVVVSVDAGANATNKTVSATPSTTAAGAFDVYVYQPTSPTSTVPVLATSPTIVRWHAYGT